MAVPPQLNPDHACLIVHGSDQPGIVAAVSAMITRVGGNIVAFDQYSDDPTGGAYFCRVVFHRPGLTGALPEFWLFALGALFIIVTLLLPKGIMGLWGQIRDRAQARKAMADRTGTAKTAAGKAGAGKAGAPA